jgi:Na+-transporting NADH:ubiquinone oxidoreductase subunit B
VVDTILFTPGTVTRTAPHVRDGLDLKRMMMIVVIALVPCMAMAVYNTGYQVNLAIAGGGNPLEGVRTDLMRWLGVPFDPADLWACALHGALYFLPVLVVTFAVGGAIEVTGAIVRKHDVNEGFFVTGFLFPLILPPDIPLWQVAIGIAFGVFIGKEIFGGTGMNFLNPALVGRAFLFFAYPAEISGNVWAAVGPSSDAEHAVDLVSAASGVDAVSGATVLTQMNSGVATLESADLWDHFIGLVPGSMGETSALACLIGAVILLATQIASWRIMLGVTLGTIFTASVIDFFGSADNPLLHIPIEWHLVLGGWALGTVFMATDPVTAPVTERARYVYGLAIGALIVLVRAVNPAYPEGVMLAILFMNVFAPLLDHFAVQANIKRRRRGYAR